MYHKSMKYAISILMILVLVACTPAAKTQDMMTKQVPETGMKAEGTATMMPKATDDMMKPTDDMMKPTDGMMKSTDTMMEPTKDMSGAMMETATPGASDMMMASWIDAELTHPASGETFKISDFKGSVVLVEPFAQWCTTCLAQQKELVKLYEAMGMESGLILVGLDIDPNEDAAMLKDYLAKNGFGWNYAIASKDMAREISQLYGDQFLNPPSAPMLLIDRKGEVHPLPFGLKSADELQKTVLPFLKDGM